MSMEMDLSVPNSEAMREMTGAVILFLTSCQKAHIFGVLKISGFTLFTMERHKVYWKMEV